MAPFGITILSPYSNIEDKATQPISQMTAAIWPIPRVTDIIPQENGPAIAASRPDILFRPKYSPIRSRGDIWMIRGLSAT